MYYNFLAIYNLFQLFLGSHLSFALRMSSNFAYLSAILGLLLGVLITVQLDRLFNPTIVSVPHSEDRGSSNRLNLKDRLTEIDDRIRKAHADRNSQRLPKISPTIIPASSVQRPISSQKSNSKRSEGNDSKKNSKCLYSFKVYVYQIPSTLPSVQISEEARRNQTLHVCQKCILEQFALEYIILDFFSNFCGRTMNPDEADFFYLPIVRDAEFRIALSKSTRNRAPSLTEQSLLALLEKNDSSIWRKTFQVTDKYWFARGGADHIIAMPAPVTNLRHESSKRGHFHYMMHLHTPIFLGLEFSLAYVKDYPFCSTMKNIVVPYPTTDPDLFGGKLHATKIERKFLLYYAGGVHGDCIEIRRAMKKMMHNSTAIEGIVPHVKTIQSQREAGFKASTFCPIPVGDSPSSKRMYDVLNFGCIPVVLSDDLVWAYSDQTGGPLSHSRFSLQLPQSTVQHSAATTLRKYKDRKDDFGRLPVSGIYMYDLLEKSHINGGDYTSDNRYVNPLVQILKQIPKEDILYLEEGVNHAAPFYRYYSLDKRMSAIPTVLHTMPTGGAIDVLVDLLSKRKSYGLEKIREECQAERNRPGHKYIARYPCEPDEKYRRRLLLQNNDIMRI